MGNLSRHLSAWRLLTSNSWVLRAVESGIRLSWVAERPPLTSAPPSARPPACPVARQALDTEVDALLTKGAIEPVADATSPGFYGRLFVVPKASGGWRPVLDLSALNRFVDCPHFLMESVASIRAAIRPGDFAVSVDLRDAYFHVLVHQRFRKWMRFVWRGQAFQFRALPFGLSTAPLIFTKIVRELLASLRSEGIRVHAYLDDWLLLAASSQTCSLHARVLVDRSMELGFIPNWDKCDLSPSQSFVYLGMAFSTVDMLVRPAPKRLDKLQETLASLLPRPVASARELSALLGQMESLAPLVPCGRLFKRPLQRGLRAQWSQSRHHWDAPIQLSPWFPSAVQWWQDRARLEQGVPISPLPHEVELFTDASTRGWGAHADHLHAAGQWSEQESLMHINLLELEAVVRALREFCPHLRGKRVMLLTDNTTVACYVNKQGGARSSSLSLRTESLLLWCLRQGITLLARHIPGVLNILADSLSRAHCILQTEWTVKRSALEPIWMRWFKPMLDLFATRYNHRLPLFVSPVPDPEAWAVDAFSISWTGLPAYAFPPLPVLAKAIRKVRQDFAEVILIAPRWPRQPWYPDLLELAIDAPLPLPRVEDLLRQPRSGILHGNPMALDLHAWRLSGSRCWTQG